MSNSNHRKRVLVTGGSRGIGKSIVRALGTEGYDVQFIYHKSEIPAESLVQELREQYPAQDFISHKIDLGDRCATDGFCEQLMEQEPFYALVHNAGQSYDTLAALVDQARAQALMQINFWSLTSLVTAMLRPMTQARSGRIVAIGSIAALQGTPGNSIYAATKGAALSYMRSLATEVASRGVTANTIAPGFVDTDMLSQYESHRELIEKQVPMGRYAKAAEIAALVKYLLSRDAAIITGSLLPIDGGITAAIGGKQ